MNTDFTIEFRRNYIHLQVSPGYQINRFGMTELWSKIEEASKTNNCDLIFIEGTIYSWKMDLSDVFDSGVTASRILPHIKVAFCFVDCTEIDLTKFFKLVTQNRGTEIMFFSDRHEALQWLGAEESSSAK